MEVQLLIRESPRAAHYAADPLRTADGVGDSHPPAGGPQGHRNLSTVSVIMNLNDHGGKAVIWTTEPGAGQNYRPHGACTRLVTSR